MEDSADAKKLLLPYLQRADELQKHEPLVAYYCKDLVNLKLFLFSCKIDVVTFPVFGIALR
jgi:hypothetical protein